MENIKEETATIQRDAAGNIIINENGGSSIRFIFYIYI